MPWTIDETRLRVAEHPAGEHEAEDDALAALALRLHDLRDAVREELGSPWLRLHARRALRHRLPGLEAALVRVRVRQRALGHAVPPSWETP
jgi:hypothetical protein